MDHESYEHPSNGYDSRQQLNDLSDDADDADDTKKMNLHNGAKDPQHLAEEGVSAYNQSVGTIGGVTGIGGIGLDDRTRVFNEKHAFMAFQKREGNNIGIDKNTHAEIMQEGIKELPEREQMEHT